MNDIEKALATCDIANWLRMNAVAQTAGLSVFDEQWESRYYTLQVLEKMANDYDSMRKEQILADREAADAQEEMDRQRFYDQQPAPSRWSFDGD